MRVIILGNIQGWSLRPDEAVGARRADPGATHGRVGMPLHILSRDRFARSSRTSLGRSKRPVGIDTLSFRHSSRSC